MNAKCFAPRSLIHLARLRPSPPRHPTRRYVASAANCNWEDVCDICDALGSDHVQVEGLVPIHLNLAFAIAKSYDGGLIALLGIG